MKSGFVLAFSLAFAATLAVLAGVGWMLSTRLIPPPPDQFMTSYFMFDLAPGWTCEFEGTVYTCSPPVTGPLPAIVIMAMKERTKEETLESFESYLRQQKTTKRADGTEFTSTVQSVRRKRLATTEWVEALHASSELYKYDTYYLATVTSYLAILVTLSAERDYLPEYSNQLSGMLSTLVVYQR